MDEPQPNTYQVVVLKAYAEAILHDLVKLEAIELKHFIGEAGTLQDNWQKQDDAKRVREARDTKTSDDKFNSFLKTLGK